MLLDSENLENRYMGKEYIKHDVFQTLDDLGEFYDNLGFNCSSFAGAICVTKLLNLDDRIFYALQGTLETIGVALKNGRINDAFSLLRKYNDAILISIYLSIKIMEEYQKTLSEDWDLKFNWDNPIDEWTRQTNKFVPGSMDKVVSAINEYEPFRELNLVISLGDKCSQYYRERKECNDNSHYNSWKYFLLNDFRLNQYLEDNALSAMTYLKMSLLEFFSIHFSYMFTIHNEYFLSPYEDYAMAGIEYDYAICPFVEDVYKKYIKPNFPQLVEYLAQHGLAAS